MKRSSILENYILTKFALIFISTLFILWGISIFVDFVGFFSRFIEHSFKDVTYYYFLYSPYIISLLIPMSILGASLFAFSDFAKNNEIIAMKSSGMSLLEILYPVIRFTILISIFLFIFSEFIVPKAEYKRVKMWKAKFSRHSKKILTKYDNIWYMGEDNNIYSIYRIFPSNKVMFKVKIFYFNKKDRFRIDSIVTCRKIKYKNNQYIGENIRVITMDSSFSKVFYYRRKKLNIKENFDNFLIEQKPPTTMNFIELSHYIKKMGRLGYNMNGLKADLYFKFAVPFLNIIIIFLSIPIVVIPKRGSNIKNIGIGIIIVFFYYITTKIGLSLAHAEILPPFIGAWLGNIIYSILGFFIFIKSRF